MFEKPGPGLVFTGIARTQADDSLINLVKFFINYGFYKFGVEVRLIGLLCITTVASADLSTGVCIPRVALAPDWQICSLFIVICYNCGQFLHPHRLYSPHDLLIISINTITIFIIIVTSS